ncbi:hypothetical protein PSU4_45090 [Pseudonocardia sulfidoxydans NBRC 16205]|uniref:Uncharacterized protein n=1 Tax=Pseudonocardia sulfidoxydans NBRC 16205 TaxID=1223511 RepID=A0A511DL97_9PSEU|nr:hypothetical protein [Pseudonocardia sulfidoxydans]GEL25555.1 hypothetical protein PSU4_45090 [Pseudonocardia sulfidoxydans NBRC 16205]
MSSTTTSTESGTSAELRLPGMLLGAAGVVAVFGLVALGLSAAARGLHGTPGAYDGWLAAVPHSLLDRVGWFLGDMTEPQFYKSPVATVGLLAGAALAWWAGRRGARWAGFPISYGSGLWPWALGAASLSLLLSNIAFGWALADGWQPTFVPFVCVATAVVLVHGGGWVRLVTGAVLGAATTTPIAMLLIATVTGPLGLPVVVSNTAAMSVGTVISFLICRVLPWMRETAAALRADPGQEATPTPAPRTGVLADAFWTVRRVVADFTETQFYANEIASIGVLLGVVVAVLLDPAFPAYGSGVVPQILFAQALTSAVGVVVWRRVYRGGGWAPTYVSLVSVAPATVLAYDGGLLATVVGAVAGALLCPVIARPISARLPKDFHPFIGNTIAMAVATTIVVPLVGLLPGVG